MSEQISPPPGQAEGRGSSTDELQSIIRFSYDEQLHCSRHFCGLYSLRLAHDVMDAKDAEIARLKQGNGILSDLLYKMEAKANNHEKLITELCDALDDGGPRPFALIHRAREATQ